MRCRRERLILPLGGTSSCNQSVHRLYLINLSSRKPRRSFERSCTQSCTTQRAKFPLVNIQTQLMHRVCRSGRVYTLSCTPAELEFTVGSGRKAVRTFSVYILSCYSCWAGKSLASPFVYYYYFFFF